MPLCDFTSVPGDKECWRSVWSQGAACATCHRNDCYRHGWSKAQVTADNAELVRCNLEQTFFANQARKTAP